MIDPVDPSLPSLPSLPENVAKRVEDDPASASKPATQLAIHRTRLSIYRTNVSRIRSHLANERTHLADVRTAIALVGFGITLNRFSRYLSEHGHARRDAPLPLRDTGHVGIGMVAFGLLVLMWSIFRYWRVSDGIERGVYVARHRATTAASLVVLMLGVWSAIWLLLR